MPPLPAKRLVAVALLAALSALTIGFAEPRLRKSMVEAGQAAPPPPMLEYVTFGHRRGVSAALWLQLLTWYGGRSMHKQRAVLDERADVTFLTKQARLIIRMDPDFPDPYSFAALALTWYAGEPRLALPFVEAAMIQFPEVWDYPFYYGFIHYRFLDDKKTAAQFFLRASRLPNVPVFVPLLAAKLMRHEDGTEDAIALVAELLRADLPEPLRAELESERTTLQAIFKAEQARLRFQQRTGRLAALEELVQAGYLDDIPADAYGVPVYIDPNGKVSARSGGLH